MLSLQFTLFTATLFVNICYWVEMAKLNFYDKTYVAYDGTVRAYDRKEFAFGFENVFSSEKHLRDGSHKSKKDLRQMGIYFIFIKTKTMKNFILFIAFNLLMSITSNGQMTLAATYGGTTSYEAQVVNLSRSGKKIAIMRVQGIFNAADTIFFYNLDYSLWKTIQCPAMPGYNGQFIFGPKSSSSDYVSYCSETLFNTDTFLEVAVTYKSTLGTNNKLLIINENGSIVDSILNVGADFRVHSTTTGVFIATIKSFSGLKVFSLPGTIPCDVCGGGTDGALGVTQVEKLKDFSTQPIPNPSSNEVKITFSLPAGASRGELVLFNSNGQKVKTYDVDNRFGFITLDNTQLQAGMYYYNIVANGEVSMTQKMVLVK